MVSGTAVRGMTKLYARLAGNIQVLRHREQKLQSDVKRKTEHLDEIGQEILALSAKMDVLNKASISAFDTDISLTDPRKTWPKAHHASWGAVTREILRQLVLANGSPMTTHELARAINVAQKLCLDEDSIKAMAERVRHRLKIFNKQGLAKRVSISTTPGEHSTWVIANFPC